MVDRLGKPRYEKMKRIESFNSNMTISEAETSTAPILLKENDIPEASLAGRKPVELSKANLLFWQRFNCDRKSKLVRRQYVFQCLHGMRLIILQL